MLDQDSHDESLMSTLFDVFARCIHSYVFFFDIQSGMKGLDWTGLG
jgi:hypothetical protein